MAILLEVAVARLEDAQTASDAGADRIELNAALELGGLTPSLGLLEEVKRAVSIPVIVMIRPRPGGFVYSEAEILTMERDADLALERGADGLAFGMLQPDRQVDVHRMKCLLKRVGGRASVFHRAFDLTPEPLEALEALVDLGVRRVLTSGQRADAPAGAEMIRRLIDRAAGRIEILPGGGITPANAAELAARVGAGQLHGSFSESGYDAGEPVCDGGYRRTSGDKIRQARAALAQLPGA